MPIQVFARHVFYNTSKFTREVSARVRVRFWIVCSMFVRGISCFRFSYRKFEIACVLILTYLLLDRVYTYWNLVVVSRIIGVEVLKSKILLVCLLKLSKMSFDRFNSPFIRWKRHSN